MVSYNDDPESVGRVFVSACRAVENEGWGMRTHLDCVPCFFRQILDAARISGADREMEKAMVIEFARRLPDMLFDVAPPEIARSVYGMVRRITGRADPYHEIKLQSIATALALYPHLRKEVDAAEDRLLKAMSIAIAGNVIDYGIRNKQNPHDVLRNILPAIAEFERGGRSEFIHYSDFRRAVRGARTILYVGDNAGETVFDRILIEELKTIDPAKTITYAVRSVPIINDALMDDALMSGLGEVATVITSGSDAPGTILSLCTEAFLDCYRSVDLVISKGQGNFETLSEEKRPIFFLLKAKCEVVAQHIGCRVGDSLVLSNEKWEIRTDGIP